MFPSGIGLNNQTCLLIKMFSLVLLRCDSSSWEAQEPSWASPGDFLSHTNVFLMFEGIKFCLNPIILVGSVGLRVNAELRSNRSDYAWKRSVLPRNKLRFLFAQLKRCLSAPKGGINLKTVYSQWSYRTKEEWYSITQFKVRFLKWNRVTTRLEIFEGWFPTVLPQFMEVSQLEPVAPNYIPSCLMEYG